MSDLTKANLLGLAAYACIGLALVLVEKSVRKTVAVETGQAADKAWERVTDKVTSGQTSPIGE
jgi:hypothetical protein